MPDFDILAFPDTACAQVVETAVRDCAIESVVVYADRAEVKRRVPVSLTTGKSEVVVHGLSTFIDKNSIRYVNVRQFLTEGPEFAGLYTTSHLWEIQNFHCHRFHNEFLLESN